MRKTNIIIILTIIVLTIIAVIILFNCYNSELNKNNRTIEKRLSDFSAYRLGTIKDIINFDYDKVYILKGEKSEQEIINIIRLDNIKVKKIDNGNINLIFVYENKIVAYLYGNTKEKGYFLDFPEGIFTQEEFNSKNFSSIAKGNYLLYEFTN